jgi:tRNA/tmRNA/rRNA uracil-C5-methylase (TrmA/RlmC/RlmD family)
VLDSSSTGRGAPVAAPPEPSPEGRRPLGVHARRTLSRARSLVPLRPCGPAPARAAVLLAVLAIPLAGCGESQQEKAQKTALNTVCTAKSDIKTRLDTLKTITPSPASLPQLKEEGQAIFEDLKKIKASQSDLAPARKQQVKQATETFQNEVSSILSSVSSLSVNSLSSAGSQLQSALSRLEASYTKALEPIVCG